MRKIRFLLFILLIGITFNVKAESFEYYITNTSSTEPANINDIKNIKRGDTITVNAILFNRNNSSNYKISSGKLTVRWDDKYLSLQEVNGKYYNDSISDITGLSIGSANKSSNKLTLNEISSTGYLKSGRNKIVELKFSVLNSAKADATKIYQMDGEDNLKCLNEEEKIIPCGESSYSELKYSIVKSNINKLSSIKIDGHELEYFNENTREYDITVENETTKVNIEAIKKDSNSTITGDIGEKQIAYGKNKFSINVISESGVKNIYTITINRIDSRSNVNTLKTLSLSEGEIKFNPNVLDYTINLENSVERITITSSLTDSKSKYVTDYQNKEIDLVEGSNKIEIKILSEKGEEKTYTLNINRALSDNNSLKSLKVNDEKIKLAENEFIYNLTFENDIDEVIITAIPNDAKATVKLDDSYPLEVGDNEINIKVIAASGQEASYILNITRKKILSKDSLLTSLKIKGYNINFKQDVTLYNLKIKDSDDELDITTTQEDANATVEIEGNKNLENGSIIKINVKAEDGSFTRYFINIEKGSSGISPIIIVLIILILLLGGCIGMIIYRKKKKEQSVFDKLDEEKNDVKENNISEEVSSANEETNDLPSNLDDNVNNSQEESNVVDEVKSNSEDNYIGAHEETKKTIDPEDN